MKIDRMPVFANLSPLSKIFFLTGIALFSMLIFLLIGTVFTAFLYGINIFSDSELLTDLDNSEVLLSYTSINPLDNLMTLVAHP